MADPMIPCAPARATSKALFIDWCPKDVLDGTHTMDPWEELAYRRLLDLAFVTGDALPDDDRRLAWMTKTGRRWAAVKAALIEAGKIEVSEGKIRVAEATAALQKTARKIAQKAAAGRASADRRKPLESNETEATAVVTAEATTQEPKNLRTLFKEKSKKKGQGEGQQGEGNALPASANDRATWEARLKGFDPGKPWSWPAMAGPRPDEPGCYAPADMLAKYAHRACKLPSTITRRPEAA